MELSALARRIANGEVFSSITVNGNYVQPLIDGATYEASHAFALSDPSYKNYYIGEYGGIVADGVVTLSTNQDSYSPGQTVTVTAALNGPQALPVSFSWSIGGDAVGVAESGTVTWEAGESGNKTFSATIPAKESGDLWQGGRAFQINASNIQNALFSDEATAWSKTVPVNSSDNNAIKNSYSKISYNSGNADDAEHFTISSTNGTVNGFQVVYTDCYFPWIDVYPFYIRVSGNQLGYIHFYNTAGEEIKNLYLAYLNWQSHTVTVNNLYSMSTQENSFNGWKNVTITATEKKPFKNAANQGHIKAETSGSPVFEVWAFLPDTSNKVVDISVPAGTYYSGQVVPITVELENYTVVNADMKLTVNGVECTPIDPMNTETKKVTFGYTVKDEDSGALALTDLVGLKNSSNEAQALDFDQVDESKKTIDKAHNVSLESFGVKSGGVNWDNAKYGIDDAAPGMQTITIVLPLGQKPNWVTTEAVQFSDQPISVDLPGYAGAMVDSYLAGAYFSCDVGKTRYPVFVAESATDGSAVLFGRITPLNIEELDLRLDTVNLFMDPTVFVASEGDNATKYLPEAGAGYEIGKPIDEDSEKPDAAVVVGKSWTLYAKGGVFFENGGDAYVDRTPKAEEYVMDGDTFKVLTIRDYSFLERQDGSYVLLQNAEHPEYQYDVEVVVNEDFINALENGVRMEASPDPQLTMQFSGRRNFTFKRPTDFTWTLTEKDDTDPDHPIAVLAADKEDELVQHVTFVGPGDGQVEFTLTVGNGVEDYAFELDAGMLIALAGKEPFLNIPEFSRIVPTLTNTDTDVLFASNITARNAAAGNETTTFTAKLYRVNAVDETPSATAEPIWTYDFTSTVEDTLTHLTVPGEQIVDPGTYAVVVTVSYMGGEINGAVTKAEEMSATAFLDVKQAPVKVTLNELESYSVTSDAIPAIGFTVNAAATVKYTVQKSGEDKAAEVLVNDGAPVTEGTIEFAQAAPTQLKDVYTITVYAKGSDDDAWSVDSMLLTVYNKDAMDLIIADVLAGEIGGTTGGTGTSVKGDVVKLDNRDKLAESYGITEGAYQLTFDDFQALRTDMSLQKVISVNYGDGVWGLLTDKLEWASSDGDTVSLEYKQGGIYSDLRNYSFTSYTPATDFLLVGKNDTGDNNVTITATHARTGMEASFEVSANRLDNELYLFQFVPKTTTAVTYTTGKGDSHTLTTSEKGELAVYEPDGLDPDGVLMAKSDVNGVTYIGTFPCSEMLSGERDIGALQVYPCNNYKLRRVADANLTILKPDGSPYSGELIIRAGVYKNGVYCPDAKVKLASDSNASRNGRSDIEATVENGKLKVGFDVSQFNCLGSEETNGLNPGEKVSYVIEYRVGESDVYRPGYIRLNIAGDRDGEMDPKDSTIQLDEISGVKTQPQISKLVMQQYHDGNMPTGYTRDVIHYTENIGISPKFNKTVLNTTVSLPAEKTVADDSEFSTYTAAYDFSVMLYTAGTDAKCLTGQTRITVKKDAVATQVTDLSALNSEEVDLFVFPFSSVPLLRSAYTMTDKNMSKDGISDQRSTPTVRVRAHVTQDNLTVRTETMPFGVSNLSHQKDLSQAGGADQIASDVKTNLSKNMSIGAVFDKIGVNSMIQSGFTFLSKISGSSDQPFSLIIMPTQDPATFRIVVLLGGMPAEDANADGVSVNYDSDRLAEDAEKFEEEMEKLSKFKSDDEPDDDDDDSGDVDIEFHFSGALYLTAKCDIANKDWDISFTGGKVGTSIKATYNWSENFMCGPVPFFVEFEASAGAKIEVSFLDKEDVRSMLLDTTLSASLRAFAGLGFDLSLVAFKLGIEGKIGADVNFKYLVQSGEADMNGTRVGIHGSIGLKVEVKLLVVSYTETFASTGFNWAKNFGDYEAIGAAWDDNALSIQGVTESGRRYSLKPMSDDTALITIQGGGEIENRDYLSIYERAWGAGIRLMSDATDLTNVLSNAYPYANPVLSDNGSMFLYISDMDNADTLESVVSYAVKNGDSYADMGALYDTEAEDAILSDSDVVASGSGSNVFAAWVKQLESPEKEMHDTATTDDLGMMMNATEIYVASYDDSLVGKPWKIERLTENNVADMAPAIASSGSRAIVAWRSLAATELPEDGSQQDITAAFNVENNINYRVYNGESWTDAQIAYNGSAGTVNAIDAAMLDNGTSILVYTVRTGDDVTSTETFYTIIGDDGTFVTTGSLTNDSNTDTNAQAVTVGDQFIVGWYTEYDEAHDIRLARINAIGSVDAEFPENIGAAGNSISSTFGFSQKAGSNDLNDLSIVWYETKKSDKAEDTGKYEINAIRFFEQKEDGAVGFTVQTKLAETEANVTIDQLDAYTDGNGIHILALAGDYSDSRGLTDYDSVNLKELGANEVPSSDASGDMLNILVQKPNTRIMIGSGSFPKDAIEAEPAFDIEELMPGLDLPVQFTVKNTGTSKIESVKVKIGDTVYPDFAVSLLPGESTLLALTYEVPFTVSDVDYSVEANGVKAEGTLVLNRPDVGITEMRLLTEGDGERDVLVRLSNASDIPLTGSGKTVMLQFFKDSDLAIPLTEAIEIDSKDYTEIDEGTYTCSKTFKITDIIGKDVEIPEKGITIYAKAWVADAEEVNTSNNTAELSFLGLKTKYNASTTMDSMLLPGEEGVYTVKVDIRNNMMQGITIGEVIADVLDSKGKVLKENVPVQSDLNLTSEQAKSVEITMDDLESVPASVRLMAIVAFNASFDANGGSGNMDAITFHEGESTQLPANEFTREGYVFVGWKDESGKEYADGETVSIIGNVTLKAQWAEKINLSFMPNSEEEEVKEGEIKGEMPDIDFPKGVSTALPKSEFTRNGYSFAGWMDKDGTLYANAEKVTLTDDTVLYAQWKKRSGGSAGSTVVPMTNDASSVSVKANVSGGTATLSKITDQQLEKLTKAKAVTENGSSVPEASMIEIDVSALGNAIQTVSIPIETVKAVEAVANDKDNATEGMTIKLTAGSVTFDAETLSAIAEQAKGNDVKLTLEEVEMESLSAAQQAALSSIQVQKILDAYLVSDGERVSNFKGGSVTVSVPHSLKDGQSAKDIVVWYVADNGELSKVPSSYDQKAVEFAVTHFSNYVIACDEAPANVCAKDSTCPISVFTDAKVNAWYHDGVHWALENGVMNGVSAGKFDPMGTATRATVVVMLWRLEGSPEVTGTSKFSDVKNTSWYGPAVIWANENGIVTGNTDGGFSPMNAVTREQLATILYRYAQYKGRDVSGSADLSGFTDSSRIHKYAVTAMQWANDAGILNGTAGRNGTVLLAPRDESARVQVATMLWRFCEGTAK